MKRYIITYLFVWLGTAAATASIYGSRFYAHPNVAKCVSIITLLAIGFVAGRETKK